MFTSLVLISGAEVWRDKWVSEEEGEEERESESKGRGNRGKTYRLGCLDVVAFHGHLFHGLGWLFIDGWHFFRGGL